MSEKWKWLEKYAPLGIGVEKHINGFWAIFGCATGYSMLFFIQYGNALDRLYTYKAGKKVLMEGAIIDSFEQITSGLFLMGYASSIAVLLMIIYYYLYHYQGSKMMYLMKRLPDKWDVHKRCMTLPVTGAVLMVVWMMILKMIYYAIYIIFTPSQCLPL